MDDNPVLRIALALSEISIQRDVAEMENAALRPQVAAMRAILEALLIVTPYSVHDNSDCFFHGDCYPEWVGPVDETGYWRHHPDCLVTKARAIIAPEGGKA